MNKTDIIPFMNQLADEAGVIARRYFRTNLKAEQKSDLSPVTLADREIERQLRKRILDAFPDHGILGEEEAAYQPDARFQWVIDPIDGTRAFMAGITTFTTLIALCEDGVPIAGTIDQPILKERWGTEPVANITIQHDISLGEAKLATTSTAFFTSAEKTAFEILQKKAASTLLGGDAYLYAMMASGYLDIVVDAGLKPYDFAALVPVVELHGGVITDWQGKALTLASSGRVIAARTAHLHSEALGILKSA